MRAFYQKFRAFDLPLAAVSFLLLILGLALIYSTSLASGSLAQFYRQSVFAVLALAAYGFFAFYNYHNLCKANRVIYPILIGVLLLVLVFAREIRGSSRWLDFGFFRFQPAEFAKLAVALGLSRWMYLRRGQINAWKNILLTLAYVLIPAALVALEPDLGSAVIILAIWLGTLAISSMNKKYLIIFALAALIFSGVAWKYFLHDYQRTRVEVFLNPNLDPRGRGYNVRQAVISVGSGGLLGRGLGQGLQSGLKFLPERQTDFVFASSAEEVGFVGSLGILALFSYLFWRFLRIMKRSKDALGFYLVGGLLFMLFSQMSINIGMNLGLLPVTGIPLPFFSYGGSSLLVVFIALGMVQNVARQSRALRF